MPFSNADLLAIKAELTNDPLTLGLTTLAADDEANANKLNLVRDTISVKKRSLAASALFNCVVDTEYQALSGQQISWLNSVLLLGQFDPFANANIVSGLDNLFSAQSETRPAIHAAIVKTGSRIEQLYQSGTVSVFQTITPSDVANARNAT